MSAVFVVLLAICLTATGSTLPCRPRPTPSFDCANAPIKGVFFAHPDDCTHLVVCYDSNEMILSLCEEDERARASRSIGCPNECPNCVELAPLNTTHQQATNSTSEAPKPSPAAGNSTSEAPKPFPAAGNSTSEAPKPFPAAGNSTSEAPKPSPAAGNSTLEAPKPSPAVGNSTSGAPKPSPAAGNETALSPATIPTSLPTTGDNAATLTPVTISIPPPAPVENETTLTPPTNSSSPPQPPTYVDNSKISPTNETSSQPNEETTTTHSTTSPDTTLAPLPPPTYHAVHPFPNHMTCVRGGLFSHPYDCTRAYDCPSAGVPPILFSVCENLLHDSTFAVGCPERCPGFVPGVARMAI